MLVAHHHAIRSEPPLSPLRWDVRLCTTSHKTSDQMHNKVHYERIKSTPGSSVACRRCSTVHPSPQSTYWQLARLCSSARPHDKAHGSTIGCEPSLLCLCWDVHLYVAGSRSDHRAHDKAHGTITKTTGGATKRKSLYTREPYGTSAVCHQAIGRATGMVAFALGCAFVHHW